MYPEGRGDFKFILIQYNRNSFSWLAIWTFRQLLSAFWPTFRVTINSGLICQAVYVVHGVLLNFSDRIYCGFRETRFLISVDPRFFNPRENTWWARIKSMFVSTSFVFIQLVGGIYCCASQVDRWGCQVGRKACGDGRGEKWEAVLGKEGSISRIRV